MKLIQIEWKYFDKDGKTCDRCFQTGGNLDAVMKQLENEYVSKGIEIEFKETKLPENRMSESNEVLINGVLLEKLIPNAKKGENYCDSCSDLIDNPKGCNCRTIKQGDVIHEEIPTNLIQQAITNYLNKERKTMKIQVFGSGCESCKKLHELAQKAVSELGIKAEVEYVTDVAKMMEMGFMTSPVLAVDGKAVITGFVPNLDKIKDAIKNSQSVQKGDTTKSKQCSCGGNCC